LWSLQRRISQVVILVGMWRISQVVAPVDGGITSCDSCKDAEKYHKLWSLSMEGSQVVVAENMGRRLKEYFVTNSCFSGPTWLPYFPGPFVSRLSLSRSQMAPSFPPLAITIYPIMMLPKKQNIIHNLQFETSLATGVNRHGCLELTSVWPGL
jgi:hypothetical protein